MGHTICLALMAAICPDANPPPLTDLKRFPPPEVVRLQLEFNQAVQSYLELRLSVAPHHAEAICTALEVNRQLGRAWDTLLDAHDTDYTETYRRSCLADLRDRLGFPAYSHGAMPPAVAYWYFREID
jgi:hypothetical protein